MSQETIQTIHIHHKLNENGEYEVEYIADIEIPAPKKSSEERIQELEAALAALLAAQNNTNV
jgi:hypothetical protein